MANDNRTVPDELLGAAVRSAQKELNAAIHAAQDAGMIVTVNTIDADIIGRAARQVIDVRVTVSRPV